MTRARRLSLLPRPRVCRSSVTAWMLERDDHFAGPEELAQAAAERFGITVSQWVRDEAHRIYCRF